MLDPWAITGQGVLKSIKKRMYWTLREKRIFDGARGLLFASHREMLNAYNVYPRLERTCRTVPYVVSPSGEESAIPATESLMQPRERKVMLFLGRVHPKKNLPFLLRAWAAAAPPPAWHLVIAGPVDEGYKRDLERLIEQLRMESCVSFAGAVTGKDKSYLLHRAEWFVLPSFQENFAIAALEALYARCPVVLSDQVQIGDALHEESEILPLRLEPWVEFLKTRMTDSAWREHLIERDAQDVLTRFSTSRITTEWISSLLSLFAC
jgi:glycosyltransferase involved in cell wall biosynthesis